MSDEEMRVAIAEAMGWKPINIEVEATYHWHRLNKSWQDGIEYASNLPDYPNDLNAMHEAELTVDQIADYGSSRSHYFAWLLVTTGICDDYEQAKSFPVNFVNGERVVSATARQRAEASLRTLGKYKETPQ